MAPSMDDDFDFSDLADLDLDDDEKAMLAQDYSVHPPLSLKPPQPFQPQPHATIKNPPGKGFNTNNITNNNNNNNNQANRNNFFHRPNTTTPKPNTKTPARDEFEDFGDLDDAALLDDKDLMEETMSSSSSSAASVRSSYFTANAPQIRPRQQQQGQGQPSRQSPMPPAQAAPPLAKPPQPTKLFSIFGGAKNQSNGNNPALQRAGSNTVLGQRPPGNNALPNTGDHNQGGLARTGSGPNAANGNSTVSPFFNNNNYAVLKSKFNTNNANAAVIPRADPTNDFAEDIFKSPEVPAQPAQAPTHHAIDQRAILTWQYPINYPKRDYQYNIIRRALFTNTLVSLPTGLGKTFIAAVVMLNYFRWFPESKIVFMAPTRPLVNQQIEACFNICGIPQEATIEMTGQSNPAIREQAWREKRVIFCTPQILSNDLKSRVCPAEALVCLVIDEAHRGTGNYAYAQIIRELEPLNRDVRVLALSATPGGDIKTVQKVVTNLKIAKIEMRTEDAMDLQAYVFKRNIQEMVVPCGREICEIRDKFARMMRPFLERLMNYGVVRTADPAQLSRFAILQGQRDYLQGNYRINTVTRNLVIRAATISMGLIHAYELLCVYGIWPFFALMDPYSGTRDTEADQSGAGTSGSSGRSRGGASAVRNNEEDDEDVEVKPTMARKAMEEIPDFMRMMDQIRVKVKQPQFVSHPKLERLVGVVVKHFTDHQDANDARMKAMEQQRAASGGGSSFNSGDQFVPLQTRVMIFANFRDSVEEIGRVLERHQPLIKVRRFIGQATAKGKKGISQKEQQRVVADFQKGEYNVLVATSIGEEGLDIGDVDLIVCYDSQSSPIRMLQRMGRTGRKRAGKICLLLAEGQEEQKYRKSQSAYKSVQRAISQNNSIVYYPHNPKIIPPGPLPTCDFVNINVPAYINPTTGKKRRRQAGDDSEPTLPQSRLPGPYLDPQEQAQFEQRYRLPKREIRTITFDSACATMLSSKRRSAMVPDKTSVVGHSTRTLGYIKTVNRMAKARVEQSLNGAMGSLAPGEQDPYTKRMLALLEKSKFLDQGQDRDFDGARGSKSMSKSVLGRNKKSGVYSHDSLDDDEMEELNHRMGGTKGSRTGRQRRVILSESEREDHTTTDDDRSKDRTRKLGGGDSSRPKVVPKPRRKLTTVASKKDSRIETGSASKSAGKAKAVDSHHGTIKSYFHTVSDDEVDREIMGGLDNMFGLPEDHDHCHHYSRGPSLSPLPLDDSLVLQVASKMRKGFDFQESSTLPVLWYRASDDGVEDDQDDYGGEEEADESLVQEPVLAFVVFEIPPVPKAGQWYRPDQEAPTLTEDRLDLWTPRTTAEKAANKSSRAITAPPPQEIMLIESSEDDAWGRQSVERDTEDRFEVPSGSRVRDQEPSRLSSGQQGFMSARTLSATRSESGVRLPANGQGQGRGQNRWSQGKGQSQGPNSQSQGRKRRAGVGQSRGDRLWGNQSSSNNEFGFEDFALTDDDDDLLPHLNDQALWD
ncbi:hypothetical protein BGX33_006366 [Mortierella sp. NVP41]|nr:hypothetical protein BGX33_006366 [Mortierella sp. NVP41]